MDESQVKESARAMMPEIMDELATARLSRVVRVPGLPARARACRTCAGHEDVRERRPRGRGAGSRGRRLPSGLGRDSGSGGRADGAALRALRRAARSDGARVGHRSVDAHDEGRRSYVRARGSRRQERSCDPRRHPARLRRKAARGRQGHHRGRRRDALPARGVRGEAPRALQGRLHDHRRHGQHRVRPSGPHDDAARPLPVHGRGPHHRPPAALGRVRRTGARCVRLPDPAC